MPPRPCRQTTGGPSPASRNEIRSRGVLHRVEAQPPRLGHAARRGEEADAEVEVVADRQPAGAEGVHAAAHVGGDPLPGRLVGAEQRVGALVAGRLEFSQLAGAQHRVPLPLADDQPDPRLAAQ